jgi:hypothetical protein
MHKDWEEKVPVIQKGGYRIAILYITRLTFLSNNYQKFLKFLLALCSSLMITSPVGQPMTAVKTRGIPR